METVKEVKTTENMIGEKSYMAYRDHNKFDEAEVIKVSDAKVIMEEYASIQTSELKADNARLTEVEYCNKCTIRNQQQTASELKAEMERLQSLWISVKDRLPEIGQLVLVWDGNTMDFGKYSHKSGRGRKIFGIHGLGQTGKITHWMSLIEPPSLYP